jgi:hypothetical protein
MLIEFFLSVQPCEAKLKHSQSSRVANGVNNMATIQGVYAPKATSQDRRRISITSSAIDEPKAYPPKPHAVYTNPFPWNSVPASRLALSWPFHPSSKITYMFDPNSIP